jgi:hypothetical protein
MQTVNFPIRGKNIIEMETEMQRRGLIAPTVYVVFNHYRNFTGHATFPLDAI